MLDEWLAWAQRCRIPAFVELGRKIKKNIAGIEAAMLQQPVATRSIECDEHEAAGPPPHGLRVPQPEHLIALALLDRGGYCPPLPGRRSA